jgi:hypothetical protein
MTSETNTKINKNKHKEFLVGMLAGVLTTTIVNTIKFNCTEENKPSKIETKVTEKVEIKVDNSVAIYGTLESPKFTILKDPVNHYDLFSKINSISDSFVQAEKRLANIESKLDSYSASELPVISEELMELHGEYMMRWVDNRFVDREYVNKAVELNDENIKSCIEEKSKQYGSMTFVGNSIFKNLTSKDVPPSLAVLIKNRELSTKDAIGTHNSNLDEIEIKDLYYELSLNAYFHELGHAIYLGNQNITDTNSNGTYRTYEIACFEEAAAYLFRINCINEMYTVNEELAKKMAVLDYYSRDLFMDAYIGGSNEEHCSGMALSCALLEMFKGNSKNAFNYLTGKNSYNSLDPVILDIIREYRDPSKNFDEQVQFIVDKSMELIKKVKTKMPD